MPAGLRELDAGEFGTQMRAFGVVTACRVIGDENTFTKFMTRQCSLGNSETLQLQQGVSMVQHMHGELEEAQQVLRVVGLHRVASVMQEVRTAPLALGQCDIFGVCALSGRVGSRFVIVRGANAHVLVDARYTHFLQSLWMLWHVAEIETARVEAYVDDWGGAGSIRSHIQNFLDRAAISDDEVALYHAAYTYVRATLLPQMQAACAGERAGGARSSQSRPDLKDPEQDEAVSDGL